MLAALVGGYAPNDLYTVMNGLAKTGDEKIDRIVELLEALVTNPSHNRYAFMGQSAELQKILISGRNAESGRTRDRAARIINVLAAKGEDSYLDLLES